MNIFEPTLALTLSMHQANLLTAALEYANHPSFVQLRQDILDQIRGQGIEL